MTSTFLGTIPTKDTSSTQLFIGSYNIIYINKKNLLSFGEGIDKHACRHT